METLLEAILNDDHTAVAQLLRRESELATCQIAEARLYDTKILHWLYARDTPLHLAAAGYRVQIAQLLIDAGADSNAAANHRRGRPLHYAADGYVVSPLYDGRQQVRMLRCLLEAGADLHAIDKNGATALHRAVRTRCAAAVKFLLEAGANLNTPNLPGSTPLHLAVQDTGRGGSGAAVAREAQIAIVKLLLDGGANSKARDGRGHTTAECARSEEIRRMLNSVNL
ncbi:MAG TPA: ankyrin repeat domain-containing protein [Humisphaera sp.]|jgi:ankyrin repeat protein|nr:ankyrin repeat domain-containing protein [Humisphaera sp.]